MTELEKLVEKDAIRDQYYVYARALDRIDNPLGKTVFAEDAQVDYGPTYKGTGYGFIDMMLKMHRKMVSTHHVMTNILIKLNEDGTKAAAVTAIETAAGAAEPPEVHRVVLDRPFVYMIVDTHANLPLFLGTVTAMN